jgi:antitoxin VapB
MLESQTRLLDGSVPLRERIRPIQKRIMARPVTGDRDDKAFYDELSGNS